MNFMMEKQLWKFLNECDVKGYTLIIPSVAVGNVSQLCCDLMIASFGMKKVISIYSPAVIPVLCHDPYDLNSKSLSGSCEIYATEEKKIIILQLRAPVAYKYAEHFFKNIIDHFKEKCIKDIIILSSSYAYENKDITASSFRYVASSDCPYQDTIKSLNWIEHKNKNADLQIFGSGFACYVFNICKERNLPCLILYKYCSEGDNIPDAYEMIFHLNRILSLSQGKNKLEPIQPASWKLLFGRPPPKDIY